MWCHRWQQRRLLCKMDSYNYKGLAKCIESVFCTLVWTYYCFGRCPLFSKYTRRCCKVEVRYSSGRETVFLGLEFFDSLSYWRRVRTTIIYVSRTVIGEGPRCCSLSMSVTFLRLHFFDFLRLLAHDAGWGRLTFGRKSDSNARTNSCGCGGFSSLGMLWWKPGHFVPQFSLWVLVYVYIYKFTRWDGVPCPAKGNDRQVTHTPLITLHSSAGHEIARCWSCFWHIMQISIPSS